LRHENGQKEENDQKVKEKVGEGKFFRDYIFEVKLKDLGEKSLTGRL
jgi:hypothetical protein